MNLLESLKNNYEGIDAKTFKHIPEISFYNYNYYVGLKRAEGVCYDLIFAQSDDDNETDYYFVSETGRIRIGYSYTSEGDKCLYIDMDAKEAE
jgi:hypothetical protein